MHGAAWTSDAEITRVEISDDSGATWLLARLIGQPMPFAWQLWEFDWLTPAQPGKTTLLARATDARGRTQPEQHDADHGPYLINHYLPMEVEVRTGDAIKIGTMSASNKFPHASADGGRTANQQPTASMKKTARTQQNKESTSNKKPSDPREYPLARDSRGSAGREEIRAKTPMVAAPRQSNRPVERSNQNRTHGR